MSCSPIAPPLLPPMYAHFHKYTYFHTCLVENDWLDSFGPHHLVKSFGYTLSSSYK